MVPPRTKDSSSRGYKNAIIPSTNRLLLCNNNAPIKLDKELLAKKSAKVASFLKNNPSEDLSAFLQDIPSEPGALELVARFCHGLEVKMSSDNIIPLICLANHLQMTETHSHENLLDSAITFLRHNILPSWDHIVRSLRTSWGPTFQQATEIGLVNVFVDALADHALSDPTLLAQPIMVEYNNNNNNIIMPLKKITNNATRRKLFSDHSSASSSSSSSDTSSIEDLTSLPVKMFELIVDEVAQRGVPQENIVGALYRYLKKHEDDKEVVEAIERLLPISGKYPLYPYTLLLELHALGTTLESSSECLASLEARIGRELCRATAEDLLALDLDVEGLRRVLKGYYGNFTGDGDGCGLVAVADLMEEYLLEVAKGGREMDARRFTEVAEMVSATTSCLGSCMDGVYRAVDAYLERKKELGEAEREEVCRVLEFQKMSRAAVEHAALNRRLPVRVGLQVLFVSQLQLRENVSRAVGECGGKEGKRRGNNEIYEVVENEWNDDDNGDDEKEEIKRGLCDERSCCEKRKKKKVSLWKGMKRKLGCMGRIGDYETLHDCNCQVTKKNKKGKKNY